MSVPRMTKVYLKTFLFNLMFYVCCCVCVCFFSSQPFHFLESRLPPSFLILPLSNGCFFYSSVNRKNFHLWKKNLNFFMVLFFVCQLVKFYFCFFCMIRKIRTHCNVFIFFFEKKEIKWKENQFIYSEKS